MKIAAFAASLLAANLAVGATSITVYGYGTDRETAKQDAFKTAIENVCGSNILSSREHFNGVTTHNKVLAYSSCRVKSHSVLEVYDDRLLVSVDIEKLILSDRLSNQSNNRNVFDNVQLSEQIRSYKEEKIAGDNLLAEIFRDYPYHAYVLKPTRTPYIVTDSARNFYIMVPYDLRWNYNYVKALRETMLLMAQPSGVGTVKIVGGGHKSFWGDSLNYNLNDVQRIDNIKNYMRGKNELRLQVSARDYTGKHVFDVCYSPEYRAGGIFYSIGVPNNIAIFGNDRQRGEVKIRLTMPIDSIYDVNVDVVAARDCKL